MNKKRIARIVICIFVAVIALGVIFKDTLIRSYVSSCNEQLETYAAKMLDSGERTLGKYGIWKTASYPEDGMVEFQTGGFGLAPSSTYKGFYYSADNTHKTFTAAHGEAISMKIDGDHATWTDGTDNHGTSRRIMENWFWFEASF